MEHSWLTVLCPFQVYSRVVQFYVILFPFRIFREQSSLCYTTGSCLSVLNLAMCMCEGFPSGSVVKNLCALQEIQGTWVWSLGWEDPLEEEMATHSSILAWKIAWPQKPGGLQSMGSQRVGHGWAQLSTVHGSEAQISFVWIIWWNGILENKFYYLNIIKFKSSFIFQTTKNGHIINARLTG